MPIKAFASEAALRRPAPPQEVHLFSRLSASIFSHWGQFAFLLLQFLATPT